MRRIHLREEAVGDALEHLLRVQGQVQFAPGRQEVTVAAQPAGVAAVEGDVDLLGDLLRLLHVQRPQQGHGADRVARAEQVDGDPAHRQAQLDLVVLDPVQGGTRPLQVLDPDLDQLAGAGVIELLRVGVLRQVLRHRLQEAEVRRGLEAVLVQAGPQVLDAAQELDDGQAEAGLVVVGLAGQVLRQRLLAGRQPALDQVLLAQRRRRRRAGQQPAQQGAEEEAEHRSTP